MHLLHTQAIVGSNPTISTKQCPRRWTDFGLRSRKKRFDTVRGLQQSCVSAEMVYSSTAVEAKGSSPLEVRKTFSMVLLEVRILPYTPNNCARSSIGLEHMPTKHEVGDSISSERTK